MTLGGGGGPNYFMGITWFSGGTEEVSAVNNNV